MAYNQETLKEVLRLANECRREYEKKAVSSIPLCISNGNTKIGRVMNVSLMPVLTCGNCKECMHYCYDIKACNFHRNTVIPARVRNLVILLKDRDRYFNEIEERISRRRKNKFFRWHVAGDIIDLDYFSRMVEIARRHPDFIFWTYTKMYSFINQYCAEHGADAIPANLHIMFSKWDGLAMENPYNFPVFAVKMTAGNIDYIPFDKYFLCPGNCDVCKECRRGCIAGENTYTNEH